jgi:putative transcriptional regulator
MVVMRVPIAQRDDAPARARRGGVMAIIVDIDVMLARRKMSIAEFAEEVGITPANVAVLKNGCKAVRFTTLDAVCRVLECQPARCHRAVLTSRRITSCWRHGVASCVPTPLA